MKDCFNLEQTTNLLPPVEAYNHFTQQVIHFGLEADQISTAAEQYDNAILVQACAAILWLSSQSQQQMTKSQPFILQMNTLTPDANNREKRYAQIVNFWSEFDFSNAIVACENLLDDYPQDLFIAYICQALYYFNGQFHNGQKFFSMARKLERYHENSAEYYALYSFAAELSGQFDQAILLANKGLSIKENLPWAHHTLSHVYTMQGNFDCGVKIIAPYADSWKGFARPIYSHNAWHLALFRIEQQNFEAALGIYDNHINNIMPDLAYEQLDNISFLWRLELLGQDVTERWQPLAPYILKQLPTLIIPFVSAHYLYALYQANKVFEANNLIKHTERNCQALPTSMANTWQKIGLPLLKAIQLYYQQHYSSAIELLTPIIKNGIYVIGGSDAQVDLFQQFYLSLLVKSNNKSQATDFLNWLTRRHSNQSLNTKLWSHKIQSIRG